LPNVGPYIYTTLAFLALLCAPYIYEISSLRVKPVTHSYLKVSNDRTLWTQQWTSLSLTGEWISRTADSPLAFHNGSTLKLRIDITLLRPIKHMYTTAVTHVLQQ